MEAIVFLATIAAIYQISRHSVEDAILRVWLPALLIVPGIYTMRVPHLPPLNASTCAIYPIGFALFARMRNWRPTRMDLWVLIFLLGAFYSNIAATGMNDGVFVLFDMLSQIFFPYLIGRLILEQDGMRERFVRRFVGIMFIVWAVSLWEFRMGTNLFTTVFGNFFPGQRPWLMQVRGGWVRVAGPYQTAELAGIMFMAAMLLARWLMYVDRDRLEKKYFKVRRSVILFLALALCVYMSESRGPWLGAIFGVILAQIGASKNVKRAAIVIGLFLSIVGTIGYFYADKYTSGTIDDAQTLEQENAIYRRILLENYKPIIERGGLFGWGAVDFPKVPGQGSIDNEFLLLQITQGKIGMWMYVLICGEAVLAILLAARKARNRVDMCFYTCLGGLVGGILLTLSTVYMGGQTCMLFFMLAGWTQSLRQTQEATEAAPQMVQGRFAFQRVFA